MDPLLAARIQMEVSLAFHMVFAALGIALPLMMLIAEWRWLRTREPHHLQLAKRWAKATALLFAVGAVSGTALSFELGLLWPPFMEFAGPIIGPAFALEGFAFFIEAIFIGLYLYGWDRLSPRQHWLTGIPIAVSGFLSGVFVVATNAWMQAPVGFTLVDGVVTEIDPLAPFKSPMWLPMAFHLMVSCYVAAAWAAAGVYAWGMLHGRRDAYHRSALGIAMGVAIVSTALLVPSGDISARAVATYQPIKLAAMEGLDVTQPGAPLRFGPFAIPYLLSLLAFRDPHAVVQGLDAFADELEPNVLLVRLSFEIMVASGALLLLVAAVYSFAWLKRKSWLEHPRMLQAIVLASPFGYIGIETGWIVTEAGRQPWTIYGIMLTREAVTPVDDTPWTLLGFSLLYLALAVALVYLLRRLARTPREEEA